MNNRGVRQTSCRHCGQDIENFFPYRRGEWHDRGNNPTCNDGKTHAPYRATLAPAAGRKIASLSRDAEEQKNEVDITEENY
jgi:hypothetical protein